ncbi:MAG: DUF1540 domain-containing protein [Christensenellales bacterium]
MPQLICGATGCVFNHDALCSAPAIHVQGGTTNTARHTYCNTFTDNVSQYVVSAMEQMCTHPRATNSSVFSAPGQVDTEFSTLDNLTEVGCTAVKCVHNNDYICMAKRVRISVPGGNKTQCDSFLKG